MGHATNLYLLNNLGIRHIINTYNSPLPKSISDNFNTLWINVLDDVNTNICKKKNEKVLVHCHMGISRSSSIVLAYLIK